jgi:hypothetical protein
MSENTGFAAYSMFHALKLHFTSDNYDYFKYHGRTNVSKQTFANRKDKYSFYKLSRKYDLNELRDFYVANFVSEDIQWVGDLSGSNGEENYAKWQKTQQSLTYNLESDTIYLFDSVDGAEFWSMDDYFKPIDGGWPMLITKLMHNKIKLETVCVLVDILGCMPRWEKQITEDIIWPAYHRTIKKYTPFIQYDKEKFKKFLKEKIKEYAEA